MECSARRLLVEKTFLAVSALLLGGEFFQSTILAMPCSRQRCSRNASRFGCWFVTDDRSRRQDKVSIIATSECAECIFGGVHTRTAGLEGNQFPGHGDLERRKDTCTFYVGAI